MRCGDRKGGWGMNKFWILFKKEVKALINVQTIAPLVLIFVLFYFMGNIMGSLVSEDDNYIADEGGDSGDGDGDGVEVTGYQFRQAHPSVGFIDNDESEYSNLVKDQMLACGMIVNFPKSTAPADAMEQLLKYDHNGDEIKITALIVINEGFQERLKDGKSPEIDVYSAIDSFGMMSMMSGYEWHNAFGMMSGIISERLRIESNVTENIYFLTNPLVPVEHTYLNNATERVNAASVLGYVTSQLSFVPIIIMLIILMAATMLATSMVTEKADKTLETLMTTPISRMSVLLSKIFSAALYAVIYAVVFVFAFQNFNDSMHSGGTLSEEFIKAVENFGITFDAWTFLIIGAQLFLSVLCGLAIALIIGMMVDDIKALQSYIMPLMIFIMIPYFLTLFVDINTLPQIAKIALYCIPFTHTFTAAANLFVENYAIIAAGLIYQVIFVAVILTLAVKIFNSDKLFTLGQILQKKPGNKNKVNSKFRLFSK
jgi:ABC-2 type transport system permease protein